MILASFSQQLHSFQLSERSKFYKQDRSLGSSGRCEHPSHFIEDILVMFILDRNRVTHGERREEGRGAIQEKYYQSRHANTQNFTCYYFAIKIQAQSNTQSEDDPIFANDPIESGRSIILLAKFVINQQKMSKPESGIELCKVPDTVKFKFVEEQEMHSSITIENLRDTIVSFKIKTNKPGLYLVKPMDGQIMNKSTTNIDFKRKELTLENFNIIQNNPGQAREKFLIEFTCDVEDSVGIMQKLQQVAYLGVGFSRVTVESSPAGVQNMSWDEGKVRKDKLIEKKVELADVIAEKKKTLEDLIVSRQMYQAKSAGVSSSNTFSLVDLINVLVITFLMGFIIV